MRSGRGVRLQFNGSQVKMARDPASVCTRMKDGLSDRWQVCPFPRAAPDRVRVSRMVDGIVPKHWNSAKFGCSYSMIVTFCVLVAHRIPLRMEVSIATGTTVLVVIVGIPRESI